MCARIRLDPKVRRDSILDAALYSAEKSHYRMITREVIAFNAQVSPALVAHYLGSIDEIRDLVLKTAIERENAQIVAQGLVARDPRACRAPLNVRREALALLGVKPGSKKRR